MRLDEDDEEAERLLLELRDKMGVPAGAQAPTEDRDIADATGAGETGVRADAVSASLSARGRSSCGRDPASSTISASTSFTGT